MNQTVLLSQNIDDSFEDKKKVGAVFMCACKVYHVTTALYLLSTPFFKSVFYDTFMCEKSRLFLFFLCILSILGVLKFGNDTGCAYARNLSEIAQ